MNMVTTTVVGHFHMHTRSNLRAPDYQTNSEMRAAPLALDVDCR